MNVFSFFLDVVLHLDKYLSNIISAFGVWTYALMFLVIFVETGLVIMPFLPGDSLLFGLGAFAAQGDLRIEILLLVLCVAAILGDSVNYWIGSFIGPKVYSEKGVRLIKKEYVDRTKKFYEKYGSKTIVLARFVPIVRTFAPFLAGVGDMKYKTFISYNIIGGIAWVALLTLLGYFFGNIPLVKNNFTFAVYIIVVVSFVPVVFEWLKHRHSAKV